MESSQDKDQQRKVRASFEKHEASLRARRLFLSLQLQVELVQMVENVAQKANSGIKLIILHQRQTIPAEAQKASYEVAYLNAQAKKPHTIGETLIKPAAVDISARDLESVPLSNGTIARRITDMAQDIKCQLVDRVKKGKYALQLDESTDILNSAQLPVFNRYSFDGKRNAVLLRAGVDTAPCAATQALLRTCVRLPNFFTKLKEEGFYIRKTVLVCVGTGLERC